MFKVYDLNLVFFLLAYFYTHICINIVLRRKNILGSQYDCNVKICIHDIFMFNMNIAKVNIIYDENVDYKNLRFQYQYNINVIE